MHAHLGLCENGLKLLKNVNHRPRCFTKHLIISKLAKGGTYALTVVVLHAMEVYGVPLDVALNMSPYSLT